MGSPPVDTNNFPSMPAPIADDMGFVTPSWRYFFVNLWNRTGQSSGAVSVVLDSIYSTPGGMLYRGPSMWTGLGPGATGTLLTMGSGPTPFWNSLSKTLDSISATRGAILYRGASSWNALPPGANGKVLALSAGLPAWTTAAVGTVTSVAQAVPSSVFTISGSPITTSGTLTIGLQTQTANRVWAGPTTGAAAAPAFRALVSADLPAGVGTVTSVAQSVPTSLLTIAGSPVSTSGTLAIDLATQNANLVFAGPASGAAAKPTFRTLGTPDLIPSTYTVSILPTPTFGMTACVTDGDAALAWGATVVNSGAGATKYLVWYNGANWTVIGK